MESWNDLLPAHLGDIRELKEQLMSQQTQIDAIVTELKATKEVVDKTATAVTTIQAGIAGLQTTQADLQGQITALKAANPTLDLTALQASADAVSADVNTVEAAAEAAVTALAPPPPPPPPPPTV